MGETGRIDYPKDWKFDPVIEAVFNLPVFDLSLKFVGADLLRTPLASPWTVSGWRGTLWVEQGMDQG